ncbi:MAG: ribonuclease HII [Candidatus Taylorbacteria bacterium]|nr:ribonuclease HII [Candidatus Taylorbacteria bacterium]
MKWIVGIDEVGRGPLAGPVCVGMCVAPSDLSDTVWSVINNARDSKQLWSYEREYWYKEAELLSLSGDFFYFTSFVSHAVIDKYGIASAIRLAINRNFSKSGIDPSDCRVLLDGSLHAPRRFEDQETVIRGDATIPIISFASIVAKVRRDRLMNRLAKQFPQYGFELNKGYGTKDHLKALKIHGPCQFHRRSFMTNILAENTLLT